MDFVGRAAIGVQRVSQLPLNAAQTVLDPGDDPFAETVDVHQLFVLIVRGMLRTTCAGV
jgi:hypothetical protein